MVSGNLLGAVSTFRRGELPMKRSTLLLLSCLAIAAVWLGHVVWGQAAETAKEKTFTITQSQLDKHVADEVAKALAADREKSGRDKPVTDDEVLNPQNWHKAIFNKAEYVIYTGPGQLMFHHWPPEETPAAKPPAGKSGAVMPTTPGPAPTKKGG
jgi:hypothetical protein